MAKIKICKEPNCKDAATTSGYCRLHYLKNWKRLRKDEQKRAARKLNKYIENMMRRHPDRYVEAIKKDIRTPGFDRMIDEKFGSDENDEGLFDEPTYDEEVRELIEKLRNKSD